MSHDPSASEREPYLTVLIPVRNEERHIGATLEMIAEQDYPRDRFEILVIDGRSTDATRRLVREFIQEHPELNVSLLDNSRHWSSSGRNIGVRAAQGQLIAVIDGHVHIPSDHLFKVMEELKEEHEALCLARPAPLLVTTNGGPARWIAAARKTWLAHSQSSYIYSDVEGFVNPMSSGFAYDRSVFDRVGLFDENFDAAEDVEFHWRVAQAGIEAYTAPALTIYSYPRPRVRDLFRQMTRYGIGRGRLFRKHPQAFTLETIVPLGLFLLFALAPLAAAASPWSPVLGIAIGAPILLYGAIVAATAMVAALRQKRIVGAPMIALAIWTTHMGLGWGLLKALLPRSTSRNRPQPS